MSNSLDPDQAGHVVGPDLGPDCLQRSSLERKELVVCVEVLCGHVERGQFT